MAKDKQEEVTEITNDEDCETELGNVDGEINDALNDLEEANYGGALESIANAQEIINKAHAYLSSKVE